MCTLSRKIILIMQSKRTFERGFIVKNGTKVSLVGETKVVSEKSKISVGGFREDRRVLAARTATDRREERSLDSRTHRDRIFRFGDFNLQTNENEKRISLIELFSVLQILFLPTAIRVAVCDLDRSISSFRLKEPSTFGSPYS